MDFGEPCSASPATNIKMDIIFQNKTNWQIDKLTTPPGVVFYLFNNDNTSEPGTDLPYIFVPHEVGRHLLPVIVMQSSRLPIKLCLVLPILLTALLLPGSC